MSNSDSLARGQPDTANYMFSSVILFLSSIDDFCSLVIIMMKILSSTFTNVLLLMLRKHSNTGYDIIVCDKTGHPVTGGILLMPGDNRTNKI